MSKKYESLPTISVSTNNEYSQPPQRPELVYLTDPAIDVMIDYHHVKPLITSPKTTIDTASIDMKSSGTHIMLVVEDDNVVGLVSSEDIIGEKPMQIIQERRVRRDEILVRAVMTPIEKLMGIDFLELRHAKVGHLLATLTDHKQHYALIIDKEENSEKQIIHGIVYIYDVVKRLEKNLPEELKEASSLLELQNKLR